MITKEPEQLPLSPELDWMLQSDRVSDAQVVAAVVRDFYSGLYRLAYWVLGDQQKTRRMVVEMVNQVACNRRKFWGRTTVRAWVYRIAYRALRKDIMKEYLKRLFQWKRALQVVNPLSPLDQVIPESSTTSKYPEEYTPVGRSSLFFKEDKYWQVEKALGKNKLLSLFLRYDLKLNIAEIAYVLGERNPASAWHKLEKTRTQLIEPDGALDVKKPGHASPAEDSGWVARNSVPEYMHASVRQSLHKAADGLITRDKEPVAFSRIEKHLSECSQCRRYSEQYNLLDSTLGSFLHARSNDHDLTHDEHAFIVEWVVTGLERFRIQRRFTFSLKEITLSAVGLILAASIFWFMSQPEMDFGEQGELGILQFLHLRLLEEPLVALGFTSGTETSQQSFSQSSRNNPAQNPGAPSSVTAPRAFLETQILPGGRAYRLIREARNPSGPVSLYRVLQYWGWQGGLRQVFQALQPNPMDETVMYYEMANFLQENSSLQSMLRMGGDLDILIRLLDAGFPVIVENGAYNYDMLGWVAQYFAVVGYDDHDKIFFIASLGVAESSVETIDYAVFQKGWHIFNSSYFIVFPGEEEPSLREVLGSHFHRETNYRYAAEKSAQETQASTGMDQLIAWFNHGTSLTYLDDYLGAAASYDQAFSLASQIPEESAILWRLLMYQPRPYWAFYYSERYDDVIQLADQTLATTGDSVLEESYYWRALAREALGDLKGALADLNASLQVNPNFAPGIYQLERIRRYGG